MRNVAALNCSNTEALALPSDSPPPGPELHSAARREFRPSLVSRRRQCVAAKNPVGAKALCGGATGSDSRFGKPWTPTSRYCCCFAVSTNSRTWASISKTSSHSTIAPGDS